jgi:hypothetical protein
MTGDGLGVGPLRELLELVVTGPVAVDPLR